MAFSDEEIKAHIAEQRDGDNADPIDSGAYDKNFAEFENRNKWANKVGAKSFAPDGYGAIEIRRRKKNVPDWAKDRETLRWRIFRPAMRRCRIAELYWLCGYSAREVVEELAGEYAIDEIAVENCIRNLKKETK